ncbi:hypothetical protein QR98_0055660, partial [Sarcoptes scabiei]
HFIRRKFVIVSNNYPSLITPRASVILNGNVLKRTSPNQSNLAIPINSSGYQLSVHMHDNSPNLGYSGDNRSLKIRGSTISSMSNHRSSYIGDEEHLNLQQQYFATTDNENRLCTTMECVKTGKLKGKLDIKWNLLILSV